MRARVLPILILFTLLWLPLQTAAASSAADVGNDTAILDFPNTLTFSADLQSGAAITSVTLEYGTVQQTCGEVVAKAFPQFDPAANLNVEWTWDMRQGGSLPPGATIWWRWRFIDETGRETISEQKTVAWLDDIHPWQTLSDGDLRLHWYDLDQSFAQDMLNAGVGGLEFNAEQSGLSTEEPIDLYVYPNYEDMRDAILYEPSWTGGMAFPEHNIVIMGTSGSDADWDRDTVVHELTHVLVGHLTFSCLGDVPTWLNEGLAVFSEGELDSASTEQLDDAIRNNTLLSVRSLSVGFSEIADKASLSYSQSYSIVRFLIETRGQDKMTELLTALRDGAPVDDALIAVYGFDVDGLEDAWRESIEATPRPVSAQPTAQPTPTFVPTIVPVSGAPLAVTPTPFVVPTSSSADGSPIAPTISPSGPPIALTIALLCFCCVFGLLIGIIVLGVVLAQRRKGGRNG